MLESLAWKCSENGCGEWAIVVVLMDMASGIVKEVDGRDNVPSSGICISYNSLDVRPSEAREGSPCPGITSG